MPARRQLAWAAAAIAAVAAAGHAYHTITWQLDARRSPELGRLVDVGGHRMMIHCTGSGSPTVILEAGLGDTIEEWRRVQPEVGQFTRVCSYDRAGYGNSEAGPFPRTSDRIARELRALLDRAGEHPPFVLVGHSAGGYHVRVFHGLYPADVVGMVLVDSVQEDQYALLPESWKQEGTVMKERWRRQARWAPLEVGLGIWRLRLGSQAPYLLLQTKYFRARSSELDTIEISAETARAAGPIGSKPLIVLTGARIADPDFARVWIEVLQPRLASLSTRGRRILLADSGHDIPADRPDAVLTAIREVLSRL